MTQITITETELAYIIHLLGKVSFSDEIRVVMRLLINLMSVQKEKPHGLRNLSQNAPLAKHQTTDASEA